MKLRYTYSAILLLALILLAFTGCEKAEKQNFDLNAQVQVSSFSVNGTAAVINQLTGAITVNLPFGTGLTNLSPSMELPAGARATLSNDKPLNFTGAVDFRVINGNVFKDYSVTAKIIPPLVNFSVNGIKATIDHNVGAAILVLPDGTALNGLTPLIEAQSGVQVSPASGVAQDFNLPVVYTFTLGSTSATYQVNLISNSTSEYAFLGTASSRSAITNPDEKAASDCFFTAYPTADYVSFGAITSGKRLSNYKVIWWHFDSDQNLPAAATATAAVNALKTYRTNGGALLLTTYAARYVENLGVVPAGKGPNNVFGDANGSIDNNSDWGISFKSRESHPIFQGLETFEPGKANFLQRGTSRLNHTAWWFIPEWGGYGNGAGWRQQTGGVNLASEAWDDQLDGRVAIAEWPQTNGAGNVVVIAFGAYDWYSEPQIGASTSNRYLSNIQVLTRNAIDYLKK